MPRPIACSFGFLLFLGIAACQSPPPSDPVTQAANPRGSERQRIAAIERAWAEVRSGKVAAAAIRPETKDIAWSTANPASVRVAAFDALLADPDAASLEETRALVRLRLARERDPAVVAYLARVAQDRDWTDASPALVRALSQPMPGVAALDRPERRALLALHDQSDVRDIAWRVFLDPGPEAAQTPDGVRRARLDAWTVLDQEDADASFRRERLATESLAIQGANPATPDADKSLRPIIDALRAASHDLRVLPGHGDELAWLLDLHASADKLDKAWWQECTSAVAALDPSLSGALHLRHIEPVRWATRHHPAWLSLDRAALLTEIASRLDRRQHHSRRARDHEGLAPRPIDDRFESWRGDLSWGDALSILVVDEALHAPGVAAALLEQAEKDRQDSTTEYGGVLIARQESPTSAPPQSAEASPDYRAVLFVPRPGQREGDQKFIASADMLAQSHRALAHYHFHAQRPRNAEYAGPSGGDLHYATRQGRTCLVFTTVADGTLNADVYHPGGATIDLGELRAAPKR